MLTNSPLKLLPTKLKQQLVWAQSHPETFPTKRRTTNLHSKGRTVLLSCANSTRSETGRNRSFQNLQRFEVSSESGGSSLSLSLGSTQTEFLSLSV